MCFFFFFFNDTATTEIYTLSLHDALPIYTTIVRDQTTAYSYQKVVTVPTITLHPVANPEGA